MKLLDLTVAAKENLTILSAETVKKFEGALFLHRAEQLTKRILFRYRLDYLPEFHQQDIIVLK